MLTGSIREEITGMFDDLSDKVVFGSTVGDLSEELYDQFAYTKILPYADVEVVQGEGGGLEYEWTTRKVSLNDYREGMADVFGDIMQFTEKGWDGTKGLDAIGEVKEKGDEITNEEFDLLWSEILEAQNSGVVPESCLLYTSPSPRD